MVTHVVLFKLLPGISPESRAALDFHAAMLDLPRQIPLIKGWRCGFNITADAQAWDYALVAEFEDRAALYQYFEEPAHLAVMARLDGLADLVFGDLSV